jgi:hypothetical protein
VGRAASFVPAARSHIQRRGVALYPSSTVPRRLPSANCTAECPALSRQVPELAGHPALEVHHPGRLHNHRGRPSDGGHQRMGGRVGVGRRVGGQAGGRAALLAPAARQAPCQPVISLLVCCLLSRLEEKPVQDSIGSLPPRPCPHACQFRSALITLSRPPLRHPHLPPTY